MKQSKSISEFTDALKNADIPAWGTIEADKLFKKEHGINVNEKWYRIFAETGSTPINQWENLPHYTILVIRDDLAEMRIIPIMIKLCAFVFSTGGPRSGPKWRNLDYETNPGTVTRSLDYAALRSR
jgi:hypothetical protein